MQTRVHLNVLLTCVLLAAVAAHPCSAADTAPAGEEIFPATFFPILPWDPQHGWLEPFVNRTNGLESIAECGFTLAGFVQPRDLALCEKLGLGQLWPACRQGTLVRPVAEPLR